MSTPKHTPGPWYCTSENDSVTGQVSTKPVGYGSYGDIALTFGDDAKANARLIAAAPDLLAALNEIASWGDGGVGPHMDEPGAACIARAAIAKATGGQA